MSDSKRPRSDSEDEDNDVPRPSRKFQKTPGIPPSNESTFPIPTLEDYGQQIDAAVNQAVSAATKFGETMKDLARKVRREARQFNTNIGPNSVTISKDVTVTTENQGGKKTTVVRINGSGKFILVVNGRKLMVSVC
jgi:hypothetical protein